MNRTTDRGDTLVPPLDAVSEALHRNACERRELQTLKRLAIAHLRCGKPCQTTHEPRQEIGRQEVSHED
jgi:hypothetical protein